MKQAIVAVMLGLLLFAKAKGDQDEDVKNKCIGNITPAVTRLNVLLAKNQVAPLTFDPTDMEVVRNHSLNPAVEMWLFKTSKTFFYCSPKSGEILSLFRNDINYIAGPGFDQPPQPSWTKEQAIAQAKAYFVALFGAFPENVGPPRLKFQPIREVPKYYPGEWNVHWPRADAKGHVFGTDSIVLNISELYGVTSAVYNFYTTYQEPSGPLISQDEALKISGSVAQTLASKFISSGLQLGTPDSIVQAIVNPNHILEVKTIQDTAAINEKGGRLAWVIDYPLTLNGAPSPHQVQVWVDAQTKEVVGGDLH